MKLIKLSATPSTNSYLKELQAVARLKDETIVLAYNQTKGRGQQLNVWQSQPANSLTFSLYKEFVAVDIRDQFYISMAASLGILNALTLLKIKNIAIKWPNDIMAEGKKCCGILIENRIKRNYINDSIIGIGLNVNEASFENLPQATSLFLVSGSTFDIEEVMRLITSEILKQFILLQANKKVQLQQMYHSKLYKVEKISVFENSSGVRFNGIIKGVTDQGLLIVEKENHVFEHFDLKQIKLLR